MNGIDILILGIFTASSLIGALRGFTKELLSLFNWGGSAFLSYALLPLGRGFFQHYIANPMIVDVVTIFCIFITSLIVLSIISNTVAEYIQESSIKGVDRSLGFGFGVVRGVFVVSASELLFSVFFPRISQPVTIQEARFAPLARKGGDTLLQILPASLQQTIVNQAIKVENQLNAKVMKNFSGEGAGLSPDNISRENFPQEYPYPNAQQQMQGFHPSTQPPMHPQPPLPQTVYGPGGTVNPPQNNQMHSPMVVIRPPSPGQPAQLSLDSGNTPQFSSPQAPQRSSSLPQGTMANSLGQAILPQNKQSTVDKLSRLEPQSSTKEETGYTQSQRADMKRLIQVADGE
ncbi:MAG: hypothetical protein FJX71_04535 [Alphaproteobacteria bacterium]|nr:hypothetical protein [Alphaproteobacteria bacterium]